MLSLILLGVTVGREQNKTYTTGAYDGYISVYGEVSHDDMRSLKRELAKVPDWLLEEYVNEKGRLFVSSVPLRDIQERYYGHVDEKNQAIGFFAVRNGIAEIWIHSSLSSIKASTIHEFGHYLDRYCSYISETDAFLIIFEVEKNLFFEVDKSAYHISTAPEYFAESFEWYLNNPRSLRKHCPQTYSFLDGLLVETQRWLE